MKKVLKVALVGFLSIGVVIVAAAFFFLSQLPSVHTLADGLVSKKKQEVQAQDLNVSQTTEMASADLSNAKSSDTSTVKNAENDFQDKKSQSSKLKKELLDDLISNQKPLSDFCHSLKNAKTGTFESKQFGEAFNDSVNTDKQDPRIQAIKPMLRFVMRLPKMTDMIESAQAAVDNHDESFFQKAEFYSTALSAFREMKDHKSDLESVMDRSYLLLGLNNLVAQKPELLNDQRLQGYCSNIELAFNQSNPVQFEQEKNDFLNFLKDMNINPKDINFDTNYKSAIEFHFNGKGMTFEGGWLSDLVKSDVEMQADLKKNEIR